MKMIHHIFISVVSVVLILSAQPLLAQDDDWGDDWGEEEGKGLEWHGFIEGASGFRFQKDPALVGQSSTLNELRLRLETQYTKGTRNIQFKLDGYYDHVAKKLRGDIRDLSLSLPLNGKIDTKIGRQVLTWGTGDFLFINDQFSKNWKAFFSGKDDEYLKQASNSIKVSYYPKDSIVDFVWTPIFKPDNYINGDVFSFFSPQAEMNVAPVFKVIRPDHGITKGELSSRIKIQKGSTEYALYGYLGYTGTPIASTLLGAPTFAKSQTFGGSVIKPLGKGLMKAEFGYQTNQGNENNLFLKKQIKFLAGYEQEVARNLTMSGQYYLEHTPNQNNLVQDMINFGIDDEFAQDEFRHVVTLRTTYMANQNNTNSSLFIFYSPSDKDGYVRPKVSHRLSDNLSLTIGANVFFGERKHTFFGQFKKANNGYLSLIHI